MSEYNTTDATTNNTDPGLSQEMGDRSRDDINLAVEGLLAEMPVGDGNGVIAEVSKLRDLIGDENTGNLIRAALDGSATEADTLGFHEYLDEEQRKTVFRVALTTAVEKALRFYGTKQNDTDAYNQVNEMSPAATEETDEGYLTRKVLNFGETDIEIVIKHGPDGEQAGFTVNSVDRTQQ